MQAPALFASSAAAAALQRYAELDETRRMQGMALDALGFGPRETPSRVVMRERGLTLKAYVDAAGTGPVILMVPAPI